MADKVVTPANVLASSGANTRQGVTAAGVTITAGDNLAKKDDGTLALFDANGAAPYNKYEGTALHGSLAGQPIVYVRSDSAFQPGYSIAAGEEVIGSATPGKTAP